MISLDLKHTHTSLFKSHYFFFMYVLKYRCHITLDTLQYLSVFVKSLKYVTITIHFSHVSCRVRSLEKVIMTIRALFEKCASMHKLWIAAHPNTDYVNDSALIQMDDSTNPSTRIREPLPIVETLLHASDPLSQCTTLDQVQNTVRTSFVVPLEKKNYVFSYPKCRMIGNTSAKVKPICLKMCRTHVCDRFQTLLIGHKIFGLCSN